MRSLFEYDIYVPTVRNDGTHVDESVLAGYRKTLVDTFGGLTDFRHRSEGMWKMGGVTFHDEILLLRVLDEDRIRARNFMKAFKAQIEDDLDQQEVLIIERDIVAL